MSHAEVVGSNPAIGTLLFGEGLGSSVVGPVWRRLIRSPVVCFGSVRRNGKMKTTTGFGLKSEVPAWDCNQKVKASEWDLDEGNNRIYNLRRTYERDFNRLVQGQPTENCELYADFLKRMKFEGISPVRQINYMRALRWLQRTMGDLPLKELNKAHTDGFLASIADTSAGTKQILFYCLKKFLVFLGKEGLLKGVKPATAKEIKVKPSDLLTREDLQKLLEAAPTARGRAFLMTLYESGARIGELLNLELKDVEFDQDGVLVDLDGKTGRRRIRLVESAECLRRWVGEIKKEHPKAVFLWFGPNESEPSNYAAMVKFLKKTTRIAGLRKKVYPHLFRHSRASELAQKLKESQLRVFMGWGAASDMPRIYIHLSAQDVDKAILELYRKEETPKDDKGQLDEIAKFFEMYRRMKALG